MQNICDDGGLSEFVDRVYEQLESLDKNSPAHKALLSKWAHLIELDENNRCILKKHERFTGIQRENKNSGKATGDTLKNAYANRRG